ncbi:MAG: branched-chain amino acid ABC transporter permease [Burkholderiaceae bacterium]|nr:branched-chain amino acid ABC transporter permease [Burkholderiaceae bacterium]
MTLRNNASPQTTVSVSPSSTDVVPKTPLLVMAALVCALALPSLGPSAFYLHLANLTLLNAIIVMGFALVASVGQLSLCHAALAGLGGYVSAVAALRFSVPPLMGILLAAAVSGLAAALLGTVILRLRGVYFILVTFLVGQGFTLIALNWDSVTHGANGMVGIPSISFLGKTFGSRADFYYVALVAFAIVLGGIYALMRSTFGRSFKSIAENILLAEACGMNTRSLQLLAFAVGSAIAGAGGAMLTHYSRYISPDSFTFQESVLYITMFVIGGRHRLAGAFLGAALLTPLPELLRNFAGYQQIIYGCVLILVLIFVPNGLTSLPSLLRGRRAAQGGVR